MYSIVAIRFAAVSWICVYIELEFMPAPAEGSDGVGWRETPLLLAPREDWASREKLFCVSATEGRLRPGGTMPVDDPTDMGGSCKMALPDGERMFPPPPPPPALSR